MSLLTCVMAWAGNKPIAPVAYQSNEYAPASNAAAPIRKAKAEVAEQDVLLKYGEVSQHFSDIQSAFNALPANSTPATITLLTDQEIVYTGGHAVTLNQFHRVTLDLNGHTMYCETPVANKSTSVIYNKGTLTIKDGQGGGKLINLATNVEQWKDAGKDFPSYYNNTITNSGTLNIESGTIQNISYPGACYAVDNNSTTGNAILNVSGTAVLESTQDYGVRLFCNSATYRNEVNISGGEIKGSGAAVWMQLPGSNQSNYKLGSFNMTGGKISGSNYSFFMYSFGDKEDHATVSISGGEISGSVVLYNKQKQNGIHASVSVSGGEFLNMTQPFFLYTYGQAIPANVIISGGSFYAPKNEYAYTTWKYQSQYTKEELEAQGYMVKDYCEYSPSNACNTWWACYEIVDWEQEMAEDAFGWIARGYCSSKDINYISDDLVKLDVAPCNSQEVTESKTMAEIAQEIEGAGEEVSASIIEINAAATEEKAVVTVTNDIEVEGIVIMKDNNKEGQIVVEEDVTLTVGNSGIVSENNDLTTVVVKPGGTIIIGNGGVDQQGNAIPVEIRNDGDKSGVFLIDPNAPAKVAQAPAKVNVYTRAHKDGGVEYWQQFASPVKGNMTITPLGVGQLEGVATSIYGWDYSADEWVRVPGMPEGTGDVKYFDKDGWSGNNILAPFAAYNLINNSLLSEGGITYEFAGELVGNDDMVLTFPANGFCVFGNSYTAPIDLTTLFDQIQNDMDLDNIDAVVYIYNSAKDRFDAVNALTLELDAMGFADAPFTQIPPQQAFVMNLLAGGSAQTAVDYAKSVWGNPQTNKNTPIMAPKRANNNTISAALNIQVTDGEATDRVFVVEDSKYSNAYDNGADAEKYMNANFNIYANSTERNLAMVATDDMENTTLTFAAGNAVNYTMSFENVLGDYMLIDNLNNNQIAIVEGATYEFVAQPNSTVEGRFSIASIYKTPTAIENAEVKSNVKGIYTLTGQFVGEDFKALPAGVYVIDGVKIVK